LIHSGSNIDAGPTPLLCSRAGVSTTQLLI
jgi:hypothetical protein